MKPWRTSRAEAARLRKQPRSLLPPSGGGKRFRERGQARGHQMDQEERPVLPSQEDPGLNLPLQITD